MKSEIVIIFRVSRYSNLELTLNFMRFAPGPRKILVSFWVFLATPCDDDRRYHDVIVRCLCMFLLMWQASLWCPAASRTCTRWGCFGDCGEDLPAAGLSILWLGPTHFQLTWWQWPYWPSTSKKPKRNELLAIQSSLKYRIYGHVYLVSAITILSRPHVRVMPNN